MRWIGKLEYLETCPIDYLSDHHNRDGEMLIGVPFNLGDTKERVIDELCNAAQASDAYADAFPSHVFQSAVESWDEADGEHRLSLFWTHRDDGRGGVELPPGADDDESDVQHWFLFTYALELEPGEVVTLPENERFGYAVLAVPGGGFYGLALDLRYLSTINAVRAQVNAPAANNATLGGAATSAHALASRLAAEHERARGEIVFTAYPPGGRVDVRKQASSSHPVRYVIERPNDPAALLAQAYISDSQAVRPWLVLECYRAYGRRRYKTERGALNRMKAIARGEL